MKRYFAFVILLFIGKLILAQDTIVKRSNEIIQAKIIEITPSEIKYKKFNFQDGPTYIENKSDILYVKYSNGLKESFSAEKITPKEEPTVNTDYYNPNAGFSKTSLKMEPYGSRYRYQGRLIGEREMQKTLMKTQDKQIISFVQNAKDAHGLSFVGFGAIPLGVAALYLLTASVNSYYGTVNQSYLAGAAVCVVGAIACPIVSGVYKHQRKANNRKAVELYNQKY